MMEVAGERFLQPGAKEIAERGGNRPVVEQSNNSLLDYGQDHQQQAAPFPDRSRPRLSGGESFLFHDRGLSLSKWQAIYSNEYFVCP